MTITAERRSHRKIKRIILHIRKTEIPQDLSENTIQQSFLIVNEKVPVRSEIHLL